MKLLKSILRKNLNNKKLQLLYNGIRFLLRIPIIMLYPITIPIMKYMAYTGEGSDFCLRNGFLPVRVHFYQPIPDISDLEKRGIWDKESKLNGIKFEPKKYIEFISIISEKFKNECLWPNEPSSDQKKFHLHNGCFSYGCAAPLHCLIRYYKPKRIIEVGSGNSSKVIASAVELNCNENHNINYIIIDPYSKCLPENFPEGTKIIKNKVETIDLSVFMTLEENDILFIDSSHVSKIGSDVNYEILDILPMLKRGVFIHFHDINIPYEYPKVYSTNPYFRVFWNEAYLLQAFLMFNDDFEIIMPMDYLQRNYLDKLKEFFPHSTKTKFGWVSGSFWIRRV